MGTTPPFRPSTLPPVPPTSAGMENSKVLGAVPMPNSGWEAPDSPMPPKPAKQQNGSNNTRFNAFESVSSSISVVSFNTLCIFGQQNQGTETNITCLELCFCFITAWAVHRLQTMSTWRKRKTPQRQGSGEWSPAPCQHNGWCPTFEARCVPDKHHSVPPLVKDSTCLQNR